MVTIRITFSVHHQLMGATTSYRDRRLKKRIPYGHGLIDSLQKYKLDSLEEKKNLPARSYNCHAKSQLE